MRVKMVPPRPWCEYLGRAIGDAYLLGDGFAPCYLWLGCRAMGGERHRVVRSRKVQ